MRLSLSGFGRVMPKSPWDDTNVIRQVIFSSERLESHAQSLATAQVIRPHRQKGRPLLDRLADNEASLLLSYQSICGGGRVEFEATIGFRARPQLILGRFDRALGFGGYVGAGAAVAALLLALPIIAH